ncbi:DUF559 domain-containing protein [Dactylosporangium sp. NPDC005555]|uniref:endonuclease domain-containing protein n=1 Tax=Dactylosporangium sp. NPDC005555 TaxID=3154889 RepID=UPI0033A659FD
MKPGPAVAHWWDVPPKAQVTHLAGVDPELLAVDLDPLPGGAPVVVQFRPAAAVPVDDQVAALLDELDRAALALYPAWLPGAERLDGPHGAGLAAVRALAGASAARSRNFGPFLADLAERGLRGGVSARRPRFPAEVRAAGLARVVAGAHGRDCAAVLVHVPEGLIASAEAALTRAAEWLAHHARLSVWLAGAPLRTVDRIRSVRLALPAHLASLADEAQRIGCPDAVAGHRPLLTVPSLPNQPRRDSPAETTLERALGPHAWARGRHWNYRYEPRALGLPYVLDLFWPSERLVVEVDGRDHRGRYKFAADRRRDVDLHLQGHVVLRFTDDDILADVGAVVDKLRTMLQQRRSPKEKIAHVEP